MQCGVPDMDRRSFLRTDDPCRELWDHYSAGFSALYWVWNDRKLPLVNQHAWTTAQETVLGVLLPIVMDGRTVQKEERCTYTHTRTLSPFFSKQIVNVAMKAVHTQLGGSFFRVENQLRFFVSKSTAVPVWRASILHAASVALLYIDTGGNAHALVRHVFSPSSL